MKVLSSSDDGFFMRCFWRNLGYLSHVLRLRTIILSVIMIMLFLGGYHTSFAQEQEDVLKVAILDSPNVPKKLSLWKRYEEAYMAGIKTAGVAAEKQGIKLQYKTFFYGEKPLDILKKIPLVQAWHPDFIVGPHYSNQFLLLKNYFPDTLVLSPYASDPSIQKLPKNFYSIFPSDNDLMDAMIYFISHPLNKVNVMMLVQIDCKECRDMAQAFGTEYKERNKRLSPIITQSDFIGSNINTLDVYKFMSNYHDGDVILIFAANYYLYENLLGRVVNSLKKRNLVFVTDVDNWGIEGVRFAKPKVATIFDYKAYRVTPLFPSLQSKDEEAKEFNQLFLNQYKMLPVDSVSYVTFLTVKSVLMALEKFPAQDMSLPMSKKVLISYKKALKDEPDWFRSNKYAVYLYTGEKEVLVNKITISKSILN